MLKVWGRVTSLNVQKVLWTLAEVGVSYERIDAGLQFGVVKTPEYLALNPNGLVPTIDDGGLVLWESNVIVRYLASRYAAGTPCPADPGERFRAERWMDWQATTITPAITPAFMGLIRKVPEFMTEAVVAEARKKTNAALAILEGALAGRDYVNGAAFTMGDIPVGVAVNRWYALPVERASFPAVEAWYARLKERPGFATHVAIPLA
ncbi:MAG TPA: glutathione S-transferase family protein [Bauldia sp.]|nr:glutathione S-transferase family protein [Bauldia sp.]